LGLNPTLSDEIRKTVRDVLFEDFNELDKNDLYDNISIISQEKIEIAK
jgi:hypothetical protein